MAELGQGTAFGLGALTACLVLFACALSVLIHYVARDTDSFRKFLDDL